MLRILKTNKLTTIALSLVALLSASWVLGAVEDQIRERLQPAGEVCVMGTACASSMVAGAGASDGPKDPAEVYQASCFACHGSGVNNSPIFGDADAWAPRIAKGEAVLLESLTNGFNNGAMPAKGLCMTCSDDDLKTVLTYMLDAAK